MLGEPGVCREAIRGRFMAQTLLQTDELFDMGRVVPPISKQVEMQERQGFEWHKPHVISQRAVAISNTRPA